MIDARRMEVFTASYDFALNRIEPPHALILDSSSFRDLCPGKQLVFCGDGCGKLKDVIERDNVVFLPNLHQDSTDMIALSEKAFRESRFLDVAYSVPEYIKAYQTTVPKKTL